MTTKSNNKETVPFLLENKNPIVLKYKHLFNLQTLVIKYSSELMRKNSLTYLISTTNLIEQIDDLVSKFNKNLNIKKINLAVKFTDENGNIFLKKDEKGNITFTTDDELKYLDYEEELKNSEVSLNLDFLLNKKTLVGFPSYEINVLSKIAI